MTWDDLKKLISRMPAERRRDPVVMILDYHGPDRRLLYLEVVQADEDVYQGISVGSECVLDEGEWFLADVEEDVAAGPG